MGDLPRLDALMGVGGASLRAIMDAAHHVSFIVTDVAGARSKILEYSRGAELMFGYPREQALGKPVAMLHLPRDIARFNEAQEAMRASRDGFKGETTLVRSSGERFTALFTTYPLRDAGGEMVAALGVSHDVDRQKRAEERFRLAAEAASDLIYEWQVDEGRIEWFGDIERALGYAPAASPHTIAAWLNLIHPEDQARLGAVVQFHASSSRRIDVEYRIRHRDGRWLTWWDRGSPILDDRGRPHRWVGVCTDVTVQRRAEDERAALEEQLHHSQKMEAIGRLAGGIAHDFNNYLTGISGNVSLALLDLDEGSPLRELLLDVDKAALRAADLTAKLLAFSRRQTAEPRVIELAAAIEATRQLLERTVGEHIQMQTRASGDGGRVRVDPGQLEQVLMNLVLNARDAMPDGGRLFIETSSVVLDPDAARMVKDGQPGSYVVLAVSDTGHGMDPATQARIFEPFFTTKPKERGTGLGLSMIYGVVAQNRGFIDVRSQPDMGTTFRVYLPRVTEAVQHTPTPGPLMEIPYGHERVLVVEDEEVVRGLAVRVLTRMGYQVTPASCGAEALSLLDQLPAPPELLLSDVVMPGMTGVQLAERVRARFPGLEVLFMSGYARGIIDERGFLPEEMHFLPKPFDAGDLARKVRDVLDGVA